MFFIATGSILTVPGSDQMYGAVPVPEDNYYDSLRRTSRSCYLVNSYASD